MTNLRHLLDVLLQARSPLVLATLVQVKGSSYRRPGARMVMDPEGLQRGVLSAGCMETDLAARVAGALALGQPQLVKYDMGTELDRIWGTGMGCEGKADVLLTPLPAGTALPWAESARAALDARRPGVLMTVFAAPDIQHVGRITWWDPSLETRLPDDLQEAAQKALATEKPQTLSQDGVMTLVDPILPPVALWIYGAGENARPLANLAIQLGWDVGMLDHRPALAQQERFPGAKHVCSGAHETLAAAVTEDARSAGVVMSHVFEPDKAMLRHMLASALPYVGLQGNRQRTALLLDELAAEGFSLTEDHKRRLHAPMGLDLGAESPETIALSVLAEIQAVLADRPPLSLRDRKGSIHG